MLHLIRLIELVITKLTPEAQGELRQSLVQGLDLNLFKDDAGMDPMNIRVKLATETEADTESELRKRIEELEEEAEEKDSELDELKNKLDNISGYAGDIENECSY